MKTILMLAGGWLTIGSLAGGQTPAFSETYTVTVSFKKGATPQVFDAVTHQLIRLENNTVVFRVMDQQQAVVLSMVGSAKAFDKFTKRVAQAIEYREREPVTADHPFVKARAAKVQPFAGSVLTLHDARKLMAEVEFESDTTLKLKGTFKPAVYCYYAGTLGGQDFVDDCVLIVLETDGSPFWPVVWKLDTKHAELLLKDLRL